MIVLLDSWVWIEYFRDGEKAEIIANYIEGENEIYISAITVSEVYRFLLHSEAEDTAKKLTKWMINRSLSIPLTSVIAWKAAEFKHKFKWGLGDSLIYASAIDYKLKIVTGDFDFKDKENVIYVGS